MSESYIHGTHPSEQERLAALNRMTNAPFVRFLEIEPRTRVLEIGSGLGILAAEVAAAADEVQVVGIERSTEQLAAAVKAPGVTYVQGDGHRLEFPDGSFDLAYCRYLLEHVADPEAVVREMRRVVRGGGRAASCENDVSLLRLDPPCRSFETVWERFQEYQRRLGGDALIGRRLYRLFRQAGFLRVELSVQTEVHWHGTALYEPFVRNIIGNVESARDGLVSAGLCDSGLIAEAIDQLRALSGCADGSAHFMWNRAMAW